MPPTLSELCEQMIDGLDLSQRSKDTYRYGLQRFQEFQGDDPITEATLYEFYTWLKQEYPPETGNAPTRTAKTYLVAARRLMNWMDLQNLLPEGVSYERMARRIDQGRGSRRESYKQRNTDDRVIDVVNYYLCQELPNHPIRRIVLLRNRALVSLLYDTATRISEALALTREDVLDGRAHKVKLTITKNSKPRTVFLSDQTRRLIREYTQERKDGPYAPLFISHGRDEGKPITASRAWQIVKEAATARGLFKTTSPHSLRHRRAQDLLDEGMPLEWVAALLGHERPDTTRIVYAFKTDEERLADMVDTYGLTIEEASTKAHRNDGKEE